MINKIKSATGDLFERSKAQGKIQKLRSDIRRLRAKQKTEKQKFGIDIWDHIASDNNHEVRRIFQVAKNVIDELEQEIQAKKKEKGRLREINEAIRDSSHGLERVDVLESIRADTERLPTFEYTEDDEKGGLDLDIVPEEVEDQAADEAEIPKLSLGAYRAGTQKVERKSNHKFSEKPIRLTL